MTRPVLALLLPLLLAASAPAQDSQPARKSKVSLKALRVTEIRHTAFTKRDGPGAIAATDVPPGLHVRLECSGRPVARSTDIGNFKLQGRDDKERKIAIDPEGPNAREGLVRIDRVKMFAPNRPPTNRIWVDLHLTLPSRDATAFTLQGEFQMQQAARKRVQVKQLKVGPIEHKDLLAAGLQVELTAVGDTYVVMQVNGALERLDEAQIFGAERQEIGLNTTRKQQDGGVRITHELSGPTQGGSLHLMVDVPTGVLTVPVQLENIPLP